MLCEKGVIVTDFMDKHFRYLKAGQKEYTEEEVRLIINGAIQEEREACAKLCDGWTHADGDLCAEAIRARGQG